MDLVNRLEPSRAYIRTLVDSGGSVLLIADLAGRTNMGDVMNWKELGRLAEMRISLGVEVFPVSQLAPR